MARLSIMGLYNYNENVFEGFNVPEGMDRQTAINEILLECAELEIIFPSFTTMKLAIANWCKIESPIWERLYNTELLNYNPLWNVDGDVTETRTVERAKTGTDSRELSATGSDSKTITGNESGSNSGQRNITGTEETDGTGTETTQKPGYNSSDLVITEQKNNTISNNTDTTTSETFSGTDGRERTETETGSRTSGENATGENSENENVNETLHTRRTGNIGVTSSQQLLREERDVSTFSTYKYIVNSFKKRFCILVY